MNEGAQIAVAPNGARRGHADHPGLPVTPAELAREAEACWAAGASLIHLHVRDEAGGHSLAPDHYLPAIEAVKAAVGDRLIVQITTEACGVFDVATQMACVRAVKPEAASFGLREYFGPGHDRAALADFFAWVAEAGVLPQFILYDPAEVATLLELVEAGVLPFSNAHALFVLGRYADGVASDPAMIEPFLAQWPEEAPWSVCAFGRSEARVAAAALARGGHVRVGFENNLEAPDGETLPSNAAQVARVAAIARLLGRALLTAEEARRLGAL
jgi:3-keto-5-aminohexanoate cleavage enzyme